MSVYIAKISLIDTLSFSMAPSLLKHDLVDDLGLLYSLYLDEQEKYLQPIAQAFRDHIFEQGSQLVSRVDFSQEEHKEHTKIKEILS